jgi:methionyl-tRNA formyltransferase
MGLRLVFMGTPDFAVPTLAALIGHGHDIAAVYSQPARPKGRGLVVDMSPVATLAAAHGIELRTPETLKDVPAQEAFAELGADAGVVVAYGLLLPKRVLDAPRLGCFNLHASLLPRWRGAAPIQRAIMAGDAQTGVMAMRMAEGLDTGPVLLAERVAIDRKTYGELHDKLAELGADVIVRVLAALGRGSISEHPQSENGVTYAKKISKEEARIDWTRSARELDCLVRGLSPHPGAWCDARGERLKILYCDPMEGHGKPGEILDDHLTVACGEGAVRLTRVQRAGRAAVDTSEFLRGFPLHRGEML